MHAYVRRGLYGTLTAGGLLLLGAVGASADTTTTGSHGAASGTQVVTPVSAPARAHDNAIAVLGRSSATSGGQPDAGSSHTAPAGTSTSDGSRTSGERGAASGTQVVAPASAPVSADGNALSVLGRSSAVKSRSNESPSAAPSIRSVSGRSGPTSSGTRGVASGSQVGAPVSAPVTVSGNSIALLGSASTASGTSGTSDTSGPSASSGKAGQTAAVRPATSGRSGAASGTQALVPVVAPVSAEGNAVSVLGRSSSTGTTTGTSAEGPAAGDSSGASTSGSEGLGSGTQVSAPVVAPVVVSGNAVSVLGQSTATTPENGAGPDEGAPDGTGSASADTTGDAPAGTFGALSAGPMGDEARMPEGKPSGEATFGVGGFGWAMQAGLLVAGPVSADGNAGVAVSDASSGPGGVASPGTPSDSSVDGVGSGSPGTEGSPGTHDPCAANIALMSGASQDVKSAGLAGGNVAGTVLSAVMLLLLGAAMGSTLRRRADRATA